jgi:hypothetical protein
MHLWNSATTPRKTVAFIRGEAGNRHGNRTWQPWRGGQDRVHEATTRNLHGQHVSAGDYITSATPQWSSGSLLLHDTYELDVVSAINSVDTKLTEPGARLFDQTVRLQVKRMCKHTALCYDPAVQVIV